MTDVIANAGATRDDLFQQALSLHERGDIQAALQAYEAILSANPADFDALHLLGVIAVQAGRPQVGVELISRAIGVSDAVAAAFSNRGCALNEMGRHAAALNDFDRAIALQPDYPEAHGNRGLALAALDRPQEALVAFTTAIGLRPDYPQVLSGLARAARTLTGRGGVSGLVSGPQDAEAHCNSGASLLERARSDEAVDSLLCALAIRPGMAEAHYNLGNAMRELGRLEEAVAHFDAARALKPDFAKAHSNNAVVLQGLGRSEAALSCCDRALAIDPTLPAAHNNRGYSLHSLGRLAEAAAAFETAIRLAGGFAQAHLNLGHTLRDLGRPAEALASFDRAIAARPGYRDAYCDKALILLRNGDYAAGWEAYEWRNQAPLPPGSRTFPQPQLSLDRDLAGATVFVHWEQGFGDTIQFCRYALLLQAKGARLIVSVQEPLVSLLKQLEPRVAIIGGALAPSAFDYHCPLLSLPFVFGTRVETIPAARAYLSADPAIAARWAARLPAGTRPRIGFAVSGRRAASNDAQRSIGMRDLAPLLGFPAEWICIQKDLRVADAETLAGLPNVTFHGAELIDFAQTAGLIANLDLVVAVDTSVAHLAAAMGKPVWLMLSEPADWRWLQARDDTPWYPSATLFRQNRAGDWPEVLARILQALADAFPTAALAKPTAAILGGGPLEALGQPATPQTGVRRRSEG
jgi:tetratricopeptide (TPR) repeat protein